MEADQVWASVGLRVALEVVSVAKEEPYRLGSRSELLCFLITKSPNVLFPRNLVSHRLPSDEVGPQSPCSRSDFVANVSIVADDRTLQMRLIHRASDRAVLVRQLRHSVWRS